MTDRSRFNVVVLGSGFGGSLLSSILSREGLSVAMVDRTRHPRFTIGESSTPAADLLLDELAARHRLPELKPLVRFGSWQHSYPHLTCGCKRGFSYFWHAAAGGFQASRDHQHELLVTANASRAVADTQWYRPDVDQFLATVAQSYSVALIEGAEVTAIEHPQPHAWTLVISHDGKPKRLHADFVIDASGPVGVLMQRLAIPDWTDQLHTRSAAVYSHWHDVRPIQDWLKTREVAVNDYPYPCEESVIHHLFSDGWSWQIGFENGLSSLGCVFADEAFQHQRRSAEETWSARINRWPVLREVFGQPRLAEFPGRHFQTGRLQRLRSAGAGDDWAALPFTVGFVDPLHSTGIAHTLSGVERVSRILLTARDNERSQALEDYSRNVVQELLHIDRLVAGCYWGLNDFRLFTTWSMLYFAAATTFEKRWLAASDRRPAILCADDNAFVRLVNSLCGDLRSVCSTPRRSAEAAVSEFCQRVRDAICPYNHVGLFEPAVPNIYVHTSAEK
jgi:FADH2 O2-dependent halogenase